MLIFELIVSLPERQPYFLRTNPRVPNVFTGTMLPTTIVFVRADPADLSRVVIDFVLGIPGAAAIAAAGIAEAAWLGVIMPGAQAIAEDDVLANGIDAAGVVQRNFDLADLNAANGDPIVGVMMAVPCPGRNLYFSKNGQRMPREKYSLVVPGATFPLKGDAQNPDLWVVEWCAVPTPGT